MGELFLVVEMFDSADPPSWNLECKAHVWGITFDSSFPLQKSALRGSLPTSLIAAHKVTVWASEVQRETASAVRPPSLSKPPFLVRNEPSI